MLVRMRMGLARRVLGTVRVLMVFVMQMRMRVSHRLVNVLMFVMLSHVQPDTYRHQSSGYNEAKCEAFSESENRNYSSKERRCREIGASPRCAQVPKRDNVEYQA